MPDFDSRNWFEGGNWLYGPVGDDLTADEDIIMEQILDNINSTPVGQVLKKIAALPEVRRKKVLSVRRQLTQGSYDLNKRLDLALEKVLEELET